MTFPLLSYPYEIINYGIKMSHFLIWVIIYDSPSGISSSLFIFPVHVTSLKLFLDEKLTFFRIFLFSVKRGDSLSTNQIARKKSPSIEDGRVWYASLVMV